MKEQSVFKRYELKYILTYQQKELLEKVMQPYMKLDDYGRTTIRNIYFDTDDYRLIRRSLEKPVYKEKLRVRSYCKAEDTTPVFVELKKKYRSVVYKRRVCMPLQQAKQWLCGDIQNPEQGQIVEEIEYFRSFYPNLHPTVFLSYEREAYYSLCGDGFRVTFDENILSREQELSLCGDIWGTSLLQEGTVLLELKTPGGIPLWMTQFLTQQRLFKTSFSKYGTAYCNQIRKLNKEEHNYA